MNEAKMSIVPKRITTVELKDIAISEVPINFGQYSIVDDGRLYYDSYTLQKRLRLGGTRVEYWNELDPENVGYTPDGDFNYKGIRDWDKNGMSNNADLIKSMDGTFLNEGDIFSNTSLVAGTAISDMRYCVNAWVKSPDGSMVPISSSSSLADETYFNEDIKITEDGGRYKPSETAEGYITLQSKGKSLIELFKDMFQVVKQPTVSPATYTATLYLYRSSTAGFGLITSRTFIGELDGASKLFSFSVERGTSVKSQRVALTIKKPSYSFLPKPSGVAVSAVSFKCASGETNYGSAESASAASSNSSYSVTVNHSSCNVVANNATLYDTVTISLSQGSIAKTNIGTDSDPVVRSLAGTYTFQMAIVPYVQGKFWGGLVNVNGSDLTSANIRSLSKSNSAWSTSQLTFTVSAGTTIVIVAIPAGKTITKIENLTAGFPDVKGDFVKRTMQVGGYNNNMTYASSYDVYYYQPVTGAYVNATQFRVSFSN